MQHTARRSFGDNGVPANGNETTTRSTEENTMSTNTEPTDEVIGGTGEAEAEEVSEVNAVARLIIVNAGWDPDDPEDDTEEDIKHIYLEAAEYVEAARMARATTVTETVAEVAVSALEAAQNELVLRDAFTDRSLRIIDGLIADYREKSAAAPVSLEAASKRFSQCDTSCTADCGHCKGGLVEGSPRALKAATTP